MSPLGTAADILASKGYKFLPIARLTNSYNSDIFRVCVAGRTNENHLILVRETSEGNHRFYLPLRGDATQQVEDLAKWLAENCE
jgi:hypothetical protein